ncbi:hypothetical protein GGR54DRAFT_210441 [Hypoxylon sp. NC1633]|nr:hypothetical protein GGR54DRAFT_210441 [Hypoxylon sp. NC1633]
MTSLAAGIVDPTKAGKYPVVLSDALLGKDPKEVLTGVRYNHKPPLSSPTAPAQARIKPTPSSSSTSKKGVPSYDLSFQDEGGRYQYKGTRGVEDGQYVLIFDASREVFVLHKVDSMFNMNLVKTPSKDNADGLRQEFPQLQGHSGSSSAKAAGPASSRQSAKASVQDKKAVPKPRKPAPKPRAGEKSALAMPEKKAVPKPIAISKQRQASADSEESSDDDLGLTIENPGGEAPSVSRDFSPNLFGIRRFSEFVQQNEEEEDDDADGEEDDDASFEHFTLPSPINRQMQETSAAQQFPHNHRGAKEEEEEEEEGDEVMEDVQQEQAAEAAEADEPLMDENELEAALMEELGGDSQAQESDVSEEE